MPATSANILARKSAPPPIAATTFARKSAPSPVTTGPKQFQSDRQIVLEKRPAAKPATVVPNRPSTNNASVQKSATSSTTTAVKGSTSASQQNSPPTSTLTDNSKLSPQELERIRINRASELYSLQRQKFIDMQKQQQPLRLRTVSEDEVAPVVSPVRQRTASEDEISSGSDDDDTDSDTLSPSPEPETPMEAGLMSISAPTHSAARGFRGAGRGSRGGLGIVRPSAASQVNAISSAKSTTATLRASRISKIRQQNSEFGQTSKASPVNQAKGEYFFKANSKLID
jgi:hypothetical protein